MFLNADSLPEVETQMKMNQSVNSENSLNSFTTAKPVVRFLKIAQLRNRNWDQIYSMESDTAKLLLQGEKQKKKLEKTNKKKRKDFSRKKTFGEDITEQLAEDYNEEIIEKEIENEFQSENKKITKEFYKMVNRIGKMKLKEGQRIPIGSKTNQGKWFLNKISHDLIVAVLVFAGSDEVSVERLLKKIEFVLNERKDELENQEMIQNDINKVIKNFGFYNFESRNEITAPSQIIIQENTLNSNSFVQKHCIQNKQKIHMIKNMEHSLKPKTSSQETCDSPKQIQALKELQKTPGNMEGFFKYENIKTPVKKLPKTRKKKNQLNLEDISKIEMTYKDFEELSNAEDSQNDLDFFEFQISTHEHEPKGPVRQSNPFKTPLNEIGTPGTVCIDLSKKFEKCVFNHKIMNSASKKIKDFDSLNYVNFSSSAKKMVPSVPKFDIAEKNEKQIKKRNSKDNESVRNYRSLVARVGLGVISILMIITLLKIFVEINSGNESFTSNSITYQDQNNSSKNMFV